MTHDPLNALYAEWTKARILARTSWLLLAAFALTVTVSAVAASALFCPSGTCAEDPAKISLTGIYLARLGTSYSIVYAVKLKNTIGSYSWRAHPEPMYLSFGSIGTPRIFISIELIESIGCHPPKECRYMHLLDDNPTTEDSLGFAPTAGAIVEAIKNISRLPLTIGVFGGWGTGKTSLMQMVEARLKQDRIKTVWFNAWKYSGKEIIWNALIQTVLLAMKNDPDLVDASRRESFNRRVIAVSLSLAKYAAKVGTRMIPGGIIKEDDVDDLWEALGSDVKDGGSFEFINKFESEFGRLVDDYVSGSYLVVFIDDLDRCLPENAIEVMEALKLYLDKANCVFVIGVEPSIIETAITTRYGVSSNLSASMYLEKIVQIPIAVPRARTDAGIKFISSVADEFSPAQMKQFRQLIRIGMERNPRRIKRVTNSYMVALSVRPEPSSVEEKLVLVKVLLLQMRFPSFFRELSRSSELIEELRDVDDEDAWGNGGVGHLYKDPELRHFLRETADVPASGEHVRTWIRVTETITGGMTETRTEA